MPLGLAQNWTDARNGNKYRIKKMLDNKCWMIDNLAYAGGGTATYGDTHTLTFATACANAVAPCTGASIWSGITTRYVTTNNYTGSAQADRNGNSIQNTTATLNTGTQCTSSVTGTPPMNSQCLSYLYSFCSAVGLDGGTTPTCSAVAQNTTGTGMASAGVVGRPGGFGGESKGNASAANQAGVNSTTSGTICPAGWRLPVGRVDGGGAINDTKNEPAILNASMNSASLNLTPNVSTGTGFYQNWQPAGSFSSIGSGSFGVGYGLNSQAYGYYLLSSLYSSTVSAYLSVAATSVLPGTNTAGTKNVGMAVRCVL